MVKEEQTIDNCVPHVRFYKGQKKTEKTPIAPWSGSTFETDYQRQNKLSEYTGVFQSVKKDCREKPMIPVSETKDWMVGNPKDNMDLTTTYGNSHPTHPRQTPAKTRPRKDHTSTFLDQSKAMKGSSTYMRSYVEKPDARRPKSFCPGPPENIIASSVDKDSAFPKTVNCETYRNYGANEQKSAKRQPIILLPEFGYVPKRGSEDVANFSSSYKEEYQKHRDHVRAAPLRPEENGIHYDLNSKMSALTTTHDRAFKSKKFPAKRTVNRNEPVGGPYQPTSTMMSDFKLKTISNPVKPFVPPVGFRKTFGDDKNGYVTGYQSAFEAPKLKTAVKNCKPIHQYKPPTEKMENQSTAHSHFTGKVCPPATSCKPKRSEGLPKSSDEMNFNTEYHERFLQGS